MYCKPNDDAICLSNLNKAHKTEQNLNSCKRLATIVYVYRTVICYLRIMVLIMTNYK